MNTGCQGLTLVQLGPGDSSLLNLPPAAGLRDAFLLPHLGLSQAPIKAEALEEGPGALGGRTMRYHPLYGSLGKSGHLLAGHISAKHRQQSQRC